MLKKISLILLSLLILGCLFVGGLAVYFMAGFPRDRLEQIDPEREESRFEAKVASILEEGALAEKSELKTYHLFSNAKESWARWLKEKEEFGYIGSSEDPNYFYINKDFNISPPFKNDCDYIYCYQHRISFDRIPSIFWKGLIGIEDYRFLTHFGVDFVSIARAIVTDIREMKLAQGGSTLTQQLVKNLFLTNKKTFTRKLKEIFYSIYVESNYSKDEILEAYFNEVFWGALQGIRIKGLYAATVFYFDTNPASVTPYQAAILISMLKGPGYYHPLRHIERLKTRADVVYRKLIDLNLFPQNVEDEWTDEEWSKWRSSLLEKEKRRPGQSMWMVLENETGDLGNFEKFIIINGANKILLETQERTQKMNFATKIFVGKPYGDSPQFRFYSKVERNLDDAIKNEIHQVGSTIKPLLYRIFFSFGKTPEDLVSIEPIELKLISGKWSPRDHFDREDKEVTMREALLKSYNRPVIHLASELGFRGIEEKLVDYIPSLQLPLAEYPAQLLGAIELPIEKIYEFYSKFIKDECKEEGLEMGRVLELLSDPSQTTVQRMVGKYIKNMRFFGKTGTTNNGYENWFIAFDGQYLYVIWFGHEGERTGEKIIISGSSSAFRIFQHFARNRGKQFHELTCEYFRK